MATCLDLVIIYFLRFIIYSEPIYGFLLITFAQSDLPTSTPWGQFVKIFLIQFAVFLLFHRQLIVLVVFHVLASQKLFEYLKQWINTFVTLFISPCSPAILLHRVVDSYIIYLGQNHAFQQSKHHFPTCMWLCFF